MVESEESPHFNTCTHAMDGCILVKDAESVAVFWDAHKNVYHYSIRYGEWYSCQAMGGGTYKRWQEAPQEEMSYLQSRVRELKALH